MNKKLATILLVTTALSLVHFPIKAAQKTTSVAATVRYDKTYFESFSPVTLLDMLRAVPGVPEILNQNRQQARRAQFSGGGGQRGFGSAGDQILMDGKRLAGKANNINDTLLRISASQVECIELIRGAASGLDVQSQGLIINIVMLEGMSTSTTFWQLKGEYSGGYGFVPEFLISHNGSKGKLDYTFSYERQNNDFFSDANEEFYDEAGTLKATRKINNIYDRFGHKINTNLAYEFEDGGRFHLNGLYEPSGLIGDETRDKDSDTLRPVFWATDRDMNKWEVGGDYTRSAGFLGNFKALFVINDNTDDMLVNRFKGTGDKKYEFTRAITAQKRSEKIFRASLTKRITQGQSIEIGGEAAINTFDKTFDSLDREDALSDLITDQSDDVEIKENRYEIFANHSYNINPQMVLQSSLTTEFSQIIADNIFSNGNISRRDTGFTYLKPRVNFRYDFTGQDQFRILIEKKVSQLNFNNFVTRFDTQEQIFKFGNTNIRPEQTWDFAFTYEHRLPNDRGSFEGEVFYRKYTDYITTIDFTNYVDLNFNSIDVDTFFALPPDQELRDYVDDNGESYSAKSGNIPSAKAYGIKLKSNLRLGFIGVPSATLSVDYTFEKRRAINQFTGEMRNFDRHPNHRINVNFRHDIMEYKFTYGFEFSARSDVSRHYINYYWPDKPAANIKIFAEKTVFTDYKIRFDAEGLTRNRGSSTFWLYSDHIRFDDLFERQEKHNTRPIELRISIQGTF